MFCKNGDLWISRKYCSAQDFAGSEKVSSATKGGMGGDRPIGSGFLAYPENIKFGVRVSGGNIGE